MFNKTVQKILDERKKLHNNDPAIEAYWEKLTLKLSQNEEQTIDFFNQSNEEDILFLSEVFEDITLNLKSSRFIELLEDIQLKFPNSDLKSCIEIAKEFSNS